MGSSNFIVASMNGDKHQKGRDEIMNQMMVFLVLPELGKKASHSRIETDNVDFGLVATGLILHYKKTWS